MQTQTRSSLGNTGAGLATCWGAGTEPPLWAVGCRAERKAALRREEVQVSTACADCSVAGVTSCVTASRWVPKTPR